MVNLYFTEEHLDASDRATRHAMTEESDPVSSVYTLLVPAVSGQIRDAMNEPVPGEADYTPEDFHFNA